MPQVNINLSKKLDEKTKNELQLAIGNSMTLLPGKNIGNTIISICDCCSLFKNGEAIEGAFIDIRLFKASPEDSKSSLSMKMFDIFKTLLGIEPAMIYINFIELEHWASNGKYS